MLLQADYVCSTIWSLKATRKESARLAKLLTKELLDHIVYCKLGVAKRTSFLEKQWASKLFKCHHSISGAGTVNLTPRPWKTFVSF